MSPWDRERGRFPRYTPKKPPPEHGIKLKKLGATWWGQRWIEALEHVLGGDAGRLARGRTYARAGRTHDFLVKSGKVQAKVTGSRPQPYRVEVALTQLPDAVWTEAIDGMAAKAQFAAELLGGQMPKQIDEVFRSAGASLFPNDRQHLKTSCSCPDWGDPCKHVAAVHYVLGEALDRDPFLLFELRGRSQDRVLSDLRSRRGDAQRAQTPTPGVSLGKVSREDYERAPRGLPALSFSFEAPAKPGALLRQLGTPSSWQGDAAPVDALAPVVQRAAASARRLALSDADAASPTSQSPEKPPPAKRAPARRARQRPATKR
jgi:uncharacterized Zn finger protein